MKFELRDYQERVVSSLISFILDPNNSGKMPLIDVATGGGKSVLIAETCKRLIDMFPKLKILNLVHTKELVEQNHEKFCSMVPNIKATLYMDSLGTKDSSGQVVFGSIQSVAPDVDKFSPNIIMVDECHWINKKSSGQYRDLISKIQSKHDGVLIIGWTGTTWRMDGGSLIDGPDKLFTDVVASVKIKELLSLGYLSPLVVPYEDIKTKYDLSSVKKTKSGDYDKDELDKRLNDDTLIHDTVEEYYRLSKGRKKHIIFGSRTKHCQNLKEAFSKYYKCEFISGSMNKKLRKKYINQFKSGELDMLISGIILTTGFDVPDIDSIGLCRDVASSALYNQIAGRGLRIAKGKVNCLWIDFTETTARHGPVDELEPPPYIDPEDKGAQKPKICPKCSKSGEPFKVPPQTRICPQCEFEFPFEESINHGSEASSSSVLSEKPEFKTLRNFQVVKHTSDKDRKVITTIRKKMANNEALTYEEEKFQPKSWAKFSFSFSDGTYTKMLCFDDDRTRFLACQFWKQIVKPEFRDNCPTHADNAIMLIKEMKALLPIKEMMFTAETHYNSPKGRKKLSSPRMESLIDMTFY